MTRIANWQLPSVGIYNNRPNTLLEKIIASAGHQVSLQKKNTYFLR